MRVSLRQIACFVAVSEQGTVSAAAKYLYLSQAAVSMALADLERQLGRTLFDRRGKRLVLNDEGHWLLPRGKSLLEQVNVIENGRAALSDLVGRLRLGASQTVASYYLPKVAAAFMVDHSQVAVSLSVGNTREIAQKLSEHQLDLAVVEGQVNQADLVATPWFEEPMQVVCGPNHPLAKEKCISIEALLAHPWALREAGSGTRMVLEQALGQQMSKVHIASEINHLPTLVALCQLDQHVSCFPRAYIAQQLAEGSLVALPDPFNLHRTLWLLEHRETDRGQVSGEFIRRLDVAPVADISK